MLRMCFSLATLCCLGVQSVDTHSRRPDALVRMRAYRATLETSHIEWSRIEYYIHPYQLAHLDDPEHNVIKTWDTEFFHTSRGTPTENNRLTINTGDAEGVRLRYADGSSMLPSSHPKEALRALVTDDGQYWHAYNESLEAEIVPARGVAGLYEPRKLGLTSRVPYGRFNLMEEPAPDPERVYEETVEDGLHIVTIRRDDTVIRYWIDPQRGWQPVRMRTEFKGRLHGESRSSLRKFDGIWFPERVEFYRGDHEDGQEPASVVRVYSATFNRPEHPRQLTPNDIGLTTAYNVIIHDADLHEIANGWWDGEKVVLVGELRAGTDESMLPPGVVQLNPLEPPAASAPVAAALANRIKSVLTEWEQYTKVIIHAYRLNHEQRQRAWAILRKCQELAQRHLSRQKEQIEQVDRLKVQLKESAGKERQKQKAMLQDLRQCIMGPIEEIFETQLIPRLDKLPTRAQREAREARVKRWLDESSGKQP